MELLFLAGGKKKKRTLCLFAPWSVRGRVLAAPEEKIGFAGFQVENRLFLALGQKGRRKLGHVAA